MTTVGTRTRTRNNNNRKEQSVKKNTQRGGGGRRERERDGERDALNNLQSNRNSSNSKIKNQPVKKNRDRDKIPSARERTFCKIKEEQCTKRNPFVTHEQNFSYYNNERQEMEPRDGLIKELFVSLLNV